MEDKTNNFSGTRTKQKIRLDQERVEVNRTPRREEEEKEEKVNKVRFTNPAVKPQSQVKSADDTLSLFGCRS